MALGFDALLKYKNAWERFTVNHPKFPMFLNAIKRDGIREGSVIEIKITDPEGKVTETNICVKADDLELFNSLR